MRLSTRGGIQRIATGYLQQPPLPVTSIPFCDTKISKSGNNACPAPGRGVSVIYICLLLSGAALLLNGLAALDALSGRDAAVFSLITGSVQLILGVTYLAVSADAAGPGTQLLLSASGIFLFGLTYVYVGLDFLLGLGSRGLGWFCGMVAAFGLLLAAAWLRDDPLLAVLWLCWSLLWTLFFVSLALGLERIKPFTGWALVLTSQVTATVPAFLGIAGFWPYRADAAALAATVLAVLLLLAGLMARRGSSDPRRAVNGRPLSSPLPSPPREVAPLAENVHRTGSPSGD